VTAESCSLNLHVGYVKNWTIKEGLREIIANAYDEGEVTFTYSNGFAFISNKGAISWRHLTLGCSEKKDNAIGQFGEGLKVGALALIRENRICEVHSNNLSVRFSLEPFHETQVLTATEIVSCVSVAGMTIVKVECTREELKEARSLFIENGNTEQLISKAVSGPVKIYVRGVYVQTMEKDGFADYNIVDKAITNRDRSILDVYRVQTQVGILILKLANPNIWYKHIMHNLECFENDCYYGSWWSLPKEIRESWTEFGNTLKRQYNYKVCFMTASSDYETRITDAGWHILYVPHKTGQLFSMAGISSEATAIKTILEERREAKKDVIQRSSLTTKELLQLEMGEYVATQLFSYPEHSPFIVLQDNTIFEGIESNGSISLTRSTLSLSKEAFLSVVAEECIHAVYDAADLSRDFQNNATHLIAKLVTTFFKV
jgi:hypothetical protein